MASRSIAPPRLEKILGRLKKNEQSLWGRLQQLNHRWLTRLETHPVLTAYVRLFRNKREAKTYLSEPSIDVEELFPVSFLLHFLLILLLLSLRVAVPTRSSEAPVVVRILDLGPSEAEKKPEPVKRASKPIPRTPPKAPVTPPPPKPTVAEQPVAEPAPVPTPIPAPVLPGPKVLAEIPRPKVVAPTTESPQSLVQLPTRSLQGGQPSVTSHIDLPAVAGPVAPPASLPDGLRRSETLPKSAPAASPLAVLASPDFATYFNMIKQRVEAVWKYPDGMTGAHRVNVVFVLDRAGKLVRAELLDSTDKRLNQSALEAMRKASPFPPLPASLKEIAGEPLRIRFNVDFGIKSTK